MPTKDELVVFRFCFKPNILLPDKSKDHGKNEHQGLEENDGKITCGVYCVKMAVAELEEPMQIQLRNLKGTTEICPYLEQDHTKTSQARG